MINAVKSRLDVFTSTDPSNPSTLSGLGNLKSDLDWALILTWADVVPPGADCTSTTEVSVILFFIIWTNFNVTNKV